MKNKKIKSSLLIIFLASIIFVSSGCSRRSTVPYEITLEVWGVFDNSTAFKDINRVFSQNNSRLKEIKYKKISSKADDYEKELVDAIASGKGPDVLYIENTWLPKHKEKLIALADSDQYLADKKGEFVDVFYTDFVEQTESGQEVYAMPLYSDTLALYYNKDMFNQAGIPFPPATWDDVKDYTKKLTKIDEYGNITQSAIALGRSQGPGAINRSTDIVSLLMMQNGSEMGNGKKIDFGLGDTAAAATALDFYTQFARGDSDVYTWNTKMDYSIDSFRYKNVAMMINYAYMFDRLKKLDPKLNFDIAPVPQVDPENRVDYTNYWGLAVTKNKELPTGVKYKNSDRIKMAWKYVKFVTNKPTSTFDPIDTYLKKTNKISARKDLLEEQKKEAFRGVFANQAFTAKSWRQPDDLAVEDIMTEMIDDVVSGNKTSRESIGTAESRINVLWKR